MNSMKRSIALLLGLILVFGMLSSAMTATATETPTEVRITFVGDEADKAGFAQSIISVTPGDDSPVSGYYLVYYTDGNETLKNYDELASIPVTDGGTVTYNVPDGIMIPVGAKGIAVFESTTRFKDTTPSIKDAVATAAIPASKQLATLGTPEFSFGAVSDVHMNYEQYSRGAYQKWANALDFYSNAGIEYVVVAGDMTGDRGETPDLEDQYKEYVDILNASDIDFNNVIECLGNHGNTSADIGLFTQYLTGTGEVHPYANSPYFHVLLKGDSGERDNLFIIMRQEIEATGESSTKDNFSKAQIDWLEGLLKTYAGTNTNIFILEHSPFLNYGAGDRKNGGYTALVTFKEEYPQTMRLKGLLETYKDVIVMSGHTHVSLYDGYNYSDEYNAFARTVHIGSTAQPCAYGGGAVYTRNTDGRYEVSTTYGSEGYTVEVYSDYIVYTGYNLSTGKIIPAACLLIPIKAYGGPGNPNLPKDPSEVFEGSGTVNDPYIIASADDFMAFTAGFNASSSTVQSEMYGYGKYFLQTADIDMTNYYGYAGTEANGNAKCYFAGTYNGNGYSLNVNINSTNQRSVFPYVYGTICNLVIKGSITSEVSAQPVRTLYGNLINCIFDVDVFSNQIANGIIYSNYGYVYNVYSTGSMTGTDLYPVASNDTAKDYYNVYYSRINSSGTALTDEYGTQSSNVTTIAAAFNNKSASGYSTALSKLGGFEMKSASVVNNRLTLTRPEAPIVNDNLALGKKYETSQLYRGLKVDPWTWDENETVNYPDEGGISFTDGKKPAHNASYSATEFAGFHKLCPDYISNGYSWITVDLGNSYWMNKFVVNCGTMFNKAAGVSVPSSISVYVSADGTNWGEAVATVTPTENESVASTDVELVLDESVEGRYVQYRMVRGGNWIMVSEVEAYEGEKPQSPDTPDVPDVPDNPEDPEVIPEDAKNFWVTHFNDNSAEGAGVIITDSEANTIGAWAWRLIVVFKPAEGLNGVYEIAEIYNHLELDQTAEAVINAHANSKIHEGGFIYNLNYGNDYINLGTGDTDFTSPNCKNAIEDALNWKLGDKFRFYHLDLENFSTPTSTPDVKWYDDAYVCTALYAPYVAPHVHTPGESATCTEDQTCTECGETLKAALGHTAGEWTTLEDGSQEQRCSVCGELLDTKPTPEQPPVDPETKTYALGDINMDGTVNQYDYILAKRAHFNTITFNGNQKVLGDMDENGENNQYDYILVKRIHFKNYSTDKTVEIVVE